MLAQGGRLVTERRMVADLYEFDLATFVWARVPPHPDDAVPGARYFHSTDACESAVLLYCCFFRFFAIIPPPANVRPELRVRDDEEKTLCSASRLFLTILFLIFVSGFAPATTSVFLFSLTLLSITLSFINLSLSFALLLLSGRKGRPGALSFRHSIRVSPYLCVARPV